MKELTIEEKELLLTDLCARLPYGVKVHIKGEYHKHHKVEEIDINYEYVRYFENLHLCEEKITNCRLYLRSMSSMTEEEMKEYHSLLIEEQKNMSYFTFCSCVTRYLDSIHVDHRAMKDKDGKWKTMIQLGLALEAPDGMYKF